MLRTIHLDKELQKITGVDVIQLDADTPHMLMSALRSQCKNFREAMIAHPQICFILVNEDGTEVSSLTTETFQFPFTSKPTDIYLLTPVIGAGSEAVAYLIMEYGFSYYAAYAIVAVATFVAYAVGSSLVMQMMAPSMDTSGGGARADERPSFLYNGAVNVVEQGYPVPLVYGIHTTGSIVVSSGIDVVEVPYIPPVDTTTNPPTEQWQAYT